MYYTAIHSSHRLQVLVEFSRKVSKLLRSSPTLSRFSIVIKINLYVKLCTTLFNEPMVGILHFPFFILTGSLLERQACNRNYNVPPYT